MNEDQMRELYGRVVSSSGVQDNMVSDSLLEADPEDALYWLLGEITAEQRSIPGDLAREVAAVNSELAEAVPDVTAAARAA